MHPASIGQIALLENKKACKNEKEAANPASISYFCQLSFITEPREEARNAVFILGVFGVLGSGDGFPKSRGSDEEQDQQQRANSRIVEHPCPRADGEEIEEDPERLLAKIVRVAGMFP